MPSHFDDPQMNDELRRIAELAEVTGGRMPFVFRDGAPAKPALAAAGFARCRALLRGMHRLAQEGAGDVAGVLLRSL
jgi:hypothetical protein